MRERSEKPSDLVRRLIEIIERSKARKLELQRPKKSMKSKANAHRSGGQLAT